MRLLFSIVFAVMLAATAYADRAGLTVDAYGVRVQGFASNGAEDVNLTIASRTIDMTNEVAWSIYVPDANCKFRTMSTATKQGLKRSVPATTWMTRNVHPRSMFINFSGCTSGELQRQ